MHAPDDTAWLESLLPLLREISPQQLMLLREVAPGREIEWSRTAPAAAQIIASSSAATAAAQQGWLLRLAARRRQSHALYVAVAQRMPACLPQLLLAAAMCRLAWKLRHWPELDRPTLRDEARDAVHALRNGLNAMVMTAAVLQETPSTPQPLLAQLEQATQQSLDALDRLSLAIFR